MSLIMDIFLKRKLPSNEQQSSSKSCESSLQQQRIEINLEDFHAFGKQSGGDTFVIEGFTNWNKKERLSSHVGGPNSAHNIAWRKCQDLMNQNQHIEQGLAFRGHDESTNSANQGNFLELLKFFVEHNESINHIVLENATENHQLIAPKIKKDIVNVVALETTNSIITNLGDELFVIIVDEARDISNKEQMTIALCYANKKGSIVERFFSMVHAKGTTTLSLKMTIDELFCKHGLSISRIHGQGYDGASNMQGEFCGLKSLILKENSSAFYVYCFAHQLQLTLVVIAKNHIQAASLFKLVSTLLNVVGGSCKRHDMLREKQINYVRETLGKGEIPSGQSLNQETSLKRVVDTHWGSHYATLINLILMYSSIIDVLEIIKENGSNADQRAEANGILHLLEDFNFAFTLHLMKNVLGILNELSQALQRKDQDIINAMNLVNITKLRLQTMRDNG
ncbi:Zinc finger MYM-type protein 1 [Glycine soja]